MDQANAAAITVIRQLIKRGEFELAVRIAACNLRTSIIAYKGKRLYRKYNKHRALAEEHALRIDNLADEALLATFGKFE